MTLEQGARELWRPSRDEQMAYRSLYMRNERLSLTSAYLRSRLHYNPETGVFTWLSVAGNDAATKSRNAKFAGKVAGNKTQHGYWRVYIDRIPCQAHCLAWLYVHGEWPTTDIDHIDRDRLNNRIANLRLATRAQNNANASVRKSSLSQIKGVSWDKQKGKWSARIKFGNRQTHIGYFSTKNDAATAYLAVAKIVFGEFATDGRPV